MATGLKHLEFKCTGCGNCCKEPLLPISKADVLRISRHTGEHPRDFVRWVDKSAIDMDDEPEAFVRLRQGKRVMVLKHEGGGCRYLGRDNRCAIYAHRPTGCRVFPFDADFTRTGKLRRLKLIPATDCLYETDGDNSVADIKQHHDRYESEQAAYHELVATWNRAQRRRQRAGKAPQTAREYLEFLGFGVPGAKRVRHGPRRGQRVTALARA